MLKADIINDAQGAVVVDGIRIEDGISSLEPNGGFTMGAPTGALGAADGGSLSGQRCEIVLHLMLLPGCYDRFTNDECAYPYRSTR
jgi:hypothetical protein